MIGIMRLPKNKNNHRYIIIHQKLDIIGMGIAHRMHIIVKQIKNGTTLLLFPSMNYFSALSLSITPKLGLVKQRMINPIWTFLDSKFRASII